MKELLKRDPPGIQDAAWHAMYQELQVVKRCIEQWNATIAGAKADITKSESFIISLTSDHDELIDALNELRLKKEAKP